MINLLLDLGFTLIVLKKYPFLLSNIQFKKDLSYKLNSFQIFHPLHPCFPSKNSKPGPNLAENYPKRKGFMKFDFINPLSVAFRLWAHQGMILGPPDYESEI